MPFVVFAFGFDVGVGRDAVGRQEGLVGFGIDKTEAGGLEDVIGDALYKRSGIVDGLLGFTGCGEAQGEDDQQSLGYFHAI